MGNSCRKFVRVCVDFQKTILAGRNFGGWVLEFWRGYVWIPKGNLGGRKQRGIFLEFFQQVGGGFPKSNLGGRKLV